MGSNPKTLFVYGKLLVYNNEHTLGIKKIKEAIDLEDIELRDSFLRILQYKSTIENFERKVINKKMNNNIWIYLFIHDLFLLIIIIFIANFF